MIDRILVFEETHRNVWDNEDPTSIRIRRSVHAAALDAM